MGALFDTRLLRLTFIYNGPAIIYPMDRLLLTLYAAYFDWDGPPTDDLFLYMAFCFVFGLMIDEDTDSLGMLKKLFDSTLLEHLLGGYEFCLDVTTW